MDTPGQVFYGTSARRTPCTRAEVLAGQVIRLSPALITITDGRTDREPPAALQRDVMARVRDLLAGGVRSFHVDINCGDYSGFGSAAPAVNTHVFTPAYVTELAALIRARDAFVTLHLLTDTPEAHLPAFADAALGAVCFQLDAVPEPARLAALVDRIRAMGACASPVVETVGTDRRAAAPPEEVHALLAPLLSRTGMLTLQAAGTGARSNRPAGAFEAGRVAAYLDPLRPAFGGTIQLQGGITLETIPAAVETGAEFLVAGTQLFRHPDGRAPAEVAAAMLEAAAAWLCS